jgi:hypothetical protein
MVQEKLEELLKILNDIDRLLVTNPEYFKEHKGKFWFSNRDHLLADTLDSWLCGNFISNKGSYPMLWYKIKELGPVYGLKLWTGEKDSFGPLTSCITYKGWSFCFG